MGSGIVQTIKDLKRNLWQGKNYDLSYVVEPGEWVIKWDGYSLTKNLNQKGLLKARTTTLPLGLKKQIIHFGSLHTWRSAHNSNKKILTCFHLDPKNPRIKNLEQTEKQIDLFHTSCQITRNKLIEIGIPKKKIVVIPLGINLALFKPKSKKKIREKLGLPLNQPIIGSFQKDGEGWGKGEKPKTIKGPDILVQTITRLKKYKPFVLLTGPARGYVKKELARRKIPYKHFYLKNYPSIAKLYPALDFYLITSRIEGGPKQILEAWASGVPVVATTVGMIPDIAQDQHNALLSKPEIKGLVQKSSLLLNNKPLQKKLVKNGLIAVKDYDWRKISQKYYQEIYKKII